MYMHHIIYAYACIKFCIKCQSQQLQLYTTNSKLTKSDITLKQNDLTWIQHGSYRLTKNHKSLLSRNGLLDDYHIGASQYLLQKQFPGFS